MQKNNYISRCLLSISLCLVLPFAFAQLCGNGSKDPNEDCDLGTALNSGSAFGCTPDCKEVAGWTCNKNVAEYRQKEAEAHQIYTDLSSKQASYFTTNGCANYLSTTNELGCYDYQEKMRKFKQLNKVIKVNCTAAGAAIKLKQRAPAAGAAQPADYDVNCGG